MSATDLEKLYRTYYMKVYSFVMTIVRDQSAAEEITQQTFYRAMHSKEKFKGGSQEFTWLCAIAKNLAADEFRRTSRLAQEPENESAGGSMCEDIEDRETSFRIHMVLHELDEPYKEVFQLRVFGELSFSDIGRIFGKTENWARVTYHRARLKIREKMGEMYE